jgi:hypothetical protein
MDFRMLGFGKNEQLRIGIDGITYLLKSKNSEGWELFESKMLTSGPHSLDIAILSNFETEDPNYISKAQV